MHQGDILRYIGQVFHAIMHGERHLYDVALLPLAVDSNIRRRTGCDVNRLTVDADFEIARLYPTRITHQQRELPLAASDSNLARLAIGKRRFLLQCDALLTPVQL